MAGAVRQSSYRRPEGGQGMVDAVRWRLRITGRVQGVGFRYFTMTAARDLGLVGWVRNQPDGSVLSEVQGPSESVKRFGMEVRRGPRFSRVGEVEVDSLEQVERLTTLLAEVEGVMGARRR